MAGNIKGITIEINGDTTRLDRALRNVNNTGRDLNNQLKDIDKSLQFNPGNTELLSQKQRVLAESVENTKNKLNTLKEAQEQAKRALADGKIGQDEYDALTREIFKAENQLKSFEQQQRQMNSTLLQMGEKIGNFGEKAGQYENDDTDREVDTDLLIAGALSRGLTLQDFEKLTIGQIVEYCITYNQANNQSKNDDGDDKIITRKATQSDWDRF